MQRCNINTTVVSDSRRSKNHFNQENDEQKEMDSADVNVNVSDEHDRLASPAGDGIGEDRSLSVELLRGI